MSVSLSLRGVSLSLRGVSKSLASVNDSLELARGLLASVIYALVSVNGSLALGSGSPIAKSSSLSTILDLFGQDSFPRIRVEQASAFKERSLSFPETALS